MLLKVCEEVILLFGIIPYNHISNCKLHLL